MATNKKNDVFANIASMQVDMEARGLVRPPVAPKNPNALPFDEAFKSFIECPKKMDTQEELNAEIAKQTELFKPFMQDLAPKMDCMRSKIDLVNFEWKTDEMDEFKAITVPHYDAPIGLHKAEYKTTFVLDDEMMSKDSLFIKFKGVDYIAEVSVNGSFVGSHEGMFAPFEFDITEFCNKGENTLSVVVKNDAPMTKNGDKIYAATGPGYDEPEIGWHHCPAGMGIYQDVYIEGRNKMFISDIFVRPMLNNGDEFHNAELWVEIFNTETTDVKALLDLSVYGQNFEGTVFENYVYEPTTSRAIGIGDSFGEAVARRTGVLGKDAELFMSHGVNFLKIPFMIENPKLWDLNTPYLYQMQVKLVVDEKVVDTQKGHFGMRSFHLDVDCEPKGQFYLNNRNIRLRGTNTMGHEQQDIMKKDWDQLLYDTMMAKVCNMNFFRITQRPIQPEFYDLCDMLGIMVQTDLPLFGVIRTNKFCEVLRQTEEMERLVRSHPSCVIDSYINEPFPNAENRPHRNIQRPSMMDMFDCCDKIIKLNNPDRLTKHVDGDYDPPSITLPDNHCYTMWYNGNGIDIGRLAKGEWMPVKKGWNYGCGEFGCEGMDTVDIMREEYPAHWLPQNEEEEKVWNARNVTMCQNGNFHYFFYETPKTLQGWSDESRKTQAYGVKEQTEAYRRNPMMVTFAIHLFIDAFPSNWMKTIVDVRRIAKPAFYAYRNALKPLMVSLHADNFKFFSGKTVKVEAWVCNDTVEIPEGATLQYTVEGMDIGGKCDAVIEKCMPISQGNIEFVAPTVESRKYYTVKLALVSKDGEVLDYTTKELEVLPTVDATNVEVVAYGEKAYTLAEQMGANVVSNANVILVSSYDDYASNKEAIDAKVAAGSKAIFLEQTEGTFNIGGSDVKFMFSSMLPLHFVSRDTGHKYVEGFLPTDFKYWYKSSDDSIVPILNYTFTTDDTFTPVLLTGNVTPTNEWDVAYACAEKKVGEGSYIVCQLDLMNRVQDNPIAKEFVLNMFTK